MSLAPNPLFPPRSERVYAAAAVETFPWPVVAGQSLALESDGPQGEILTWGAKSPLPFYHGHLPAAGALLPPVRVRTRAGDALPLTPLLSVQLCAVCGQWTAFYLDKHDRDKHRTQFLDFVEGHSSDQKDLEPLRT